MKQCNMALQCRAQPSQAKVFTVQDLLLLDFFVSITRARCLDHASRNCAWTALYSMGKVQVDGAYLHTRRAAGVSNLRHRCQRFP